MKLLFRRDQRSGMLGKVLFSLEVRADLTPEEKANVAKYKLGETMLYQRFPDVDLGPGVKGAVSNFTRDMMNVEIKVEDFANGRRFEFKNILEMLSAQAAIKQAAQTFKTVLEAAAQFGGEEIIEI